MYNVENMEKYIFNTSNIAKTIYHFDKKNS